MPENVDNVKGVSENVQIAKINVKTDTTKSCVPNCTECQKLKQKESCAYLALRSWG